MRSLWRHQSSKIFPPVRSRVDNSKMLRGLAGPRLGHDLYWPDNSNKRAALRRSAVGGA